MTAPDGRARYIAGLRKLSDLLEQHPEIPLPTSGSVSPIYIPLIGEDARRVDAVMEAFGGVFVYQESGGHAFHETRAPGVLVSLMIGDPDVTP